MRVLVTGAAGQLGRCIRRCVARMTDVEVGTWGTDNVMSTCCEGCSDTYLLTDVVDMDITNRTSVVEYVADNDIDVIINCAAYTDVERAEDEPERAHLINATAVGHLAEAARQNNALLIHISTDYVFMGGCCGLLTEESHPRPINAYGRTKLAGEETIMASGCHYIILRTAWLYSEYGNNFVKTMLRLTAENRSVSVVSDQLGTPTYAGDLAEAVVTIISERNFHEGVYHYTNLGECSRWQFACEIARVAGHTECEVKPCTTDQYPTKARRPMSAVLDKSKFLKTFGIEIPEWRASLKKCIDELKA